ncbi:Pls/PosA family non-ribosomal peptide synthetase [Prauserella aidingensis]|uniref:Pls/PosA family non-ribosomal peptide synthetase n=1 Tax=Prauserella aidingensis TaxID=387890 RepID=UPI003FD719EC
MPATVPRSRAGAGRPRLHRFFETTVDRVPDRVAVVDGPVEVTYRQLEARANRLAHHLRQRGIGTGSRVGVWLGRSPDAYACVLGVLKAGAAFVPIDPAAPPDRVAYIADDADLALLITSAALAATVTVSSRAVLAIDRAGRVLGEQPASRLDVDAAGDAAAYVMYTSGSTGRPKGVEIAQSSICNFIAVVPGIYDIRPEDRVYQGMTLSFDFSIEEIWPTWAVGATLVVGPTDAARFGEELADFLDESGVTVLYCVPTLLATIERELPTVRTVLVGGESCPAELVERWSTPHRRMLNTYGPTETTVTALWSELVPGRTVTVGRPLPTYGVALLDEELREVPSGAVGEICIGGPGVATGYVGMPELTAERFVPHELAPSGRRLYRTGDLGRFTPDGEVEYLGRADAEVKVRGHRVDLGEVESLLLEDPEVAAAAVALPGNGTAELAAYVTLRRGSGENGASPELAARLRHALQRRLPDYMVPASLDVLAALPTMPSGKIDRPSLPPPGGRRLRAGGPATVVPATELERQVAAVWSDALDVPAGQLSADADFFADLGGHSLLAARAVSLLRQRGVGDGPAVRDLYAHPTIRTLAHHLGTPRAPGTTVAAVAAGPGPVRRMRRRGAAALRIPAGLAQAAFLLVLIGTGALPVALVYASFGGGVAAPGALGPLALAALVSYATMRWVLPPLLVRLLSAGVRPGRYRLWGVTYLRLWALDIVLTLAPLPVLSGSALMGPYLRLLGAQVGRRTHLGSGMVSLPALLSIGDDATVGYGAALRPWIVEHEWVAVAPVVVGDGASVGASAVLEPGARVRDRGGVAEHTVLSRNQHVPEGRWWGGSPAKPLTEPDPVVAAIEELPATGGWSRRAFAGTVAGLAMLELTMIAAVAPAIVLVWTVLLLGGTVAGLIAAAVAGPVFVVSVCALVAALRPVVLPRIPLGIHAARSSLGVRKWMADALLATSLTLTNSLYSTLYTVPWLRALGARVGRGAEVSTIAHVDPELLVLRDGSFVADMASVGAATFHRGYLNFAPTEVGRRSFVGNAAFVPAGTHTGPDTLIGVLTVPPRSGVPAGSSWLGAPAMHLPRRESSGDHPESETFRPPKIRVAERLAIEFVRVTAPASILAAALYLVLLTLSEVASATGTAVTVALAPCLFAAGSLAVYLTVVLAKWAVVGRYRPRWEPLWSRFVRRTELVTGLYEAAAVPALLGVLAGTPWLPPALRLLGARIGWGAWLGTTYLTEFDLVHVGRGATVGRGASLQTHLFEDRVMKMSHVRIGAGASVGDRSVVLYDATVEDRATLGPLSLVMKGERLTRLTRWIGIPAQSDPLPPREPQ